MSKPKNQLVKISQQLARRMFLHTQGLDGRIKTAKGKEGVFQTIDRLGYVQLDTIAVIHRAHHHILWTRRPDYRPEMLDDLMADDRRIFEFWSHAASYLPIDDYRYYLPRMKSFREGKVRWAQYVQKKFGHLADPVLDQIREKGPVASRDLKIHKGRKKGAWWNWNPIRYALEILFWRGDVMVAQRRNFQRVYDLTERVLPNNIDMRLPENDELGRFLVRRALSAYGTATESDIHNHIYGAEKEIISRTLYDLIDSGEVMAIQVVDDSNKKSYALTDILETTSGLRRKKPALHLLSPFDNLIIQRDRTKRLFGFDYSLECYKPAPKRQFGYFVLPILWGEDLVGRLDPKADRKKKTLIIRSLFLEPGFVPNDEFLAALAKKLNAFALFNKCEEIKLEITTPVPVGKNLQNYLDHR